jgi:hypothetical protein
MACGCSHGKRARVIAKVREAVTRFGRNCLRHEGGHHATDRNIRDAIGGAANATETLIVIVVIFLFLGCSDQC